MADCRESQLLSSIADHIVCAYLKDGQEGVGDPVLTKQISIALVTPQLGISTVFPKSLTVSH